MDEENRGLGNFSAQNFEIAEGQEQILKVPPGMLRPFQGHTFQIRDDDDMKRLLESVRENGILEPALAFHNEEGELELISGHRRQRAAITLGLEVMPVLVRDVDRNQATILMGEANLTNRESILPSEKAFTYKAMMEAMRQMPDVEKGGRLRDLLAKRVGDSSSQIHRFIRLTDLNQALLDLLDTKKIGLRPAVHLSYLTPELQQLVLDVCTENETLPSLDQAKQMHTLVEEGVLDEARIQDIFSKKKDAGEENRLSFKSPVLVSMLSSCRSIAEREDRIIRALKLLEAQEREYEIAKRSESQEQYEESHEGE